ncbi:bacterial proteasome activator family protein [Aeromicrobium sp.]|uniref:bacterial proteasome activator family protein n=1 Tax=Aeromicrobium sp. TaxID=1871063 RepID=UPI003D6B0DA8
MTERESTEEESAEVTATVIGPDGQPVEVPVPKEREGSLTDLVEQPAKVMRIGGMIRQLLEEVKSAPLDRASRNRLREIHEQSITELEDGLAPELIEELERLSLPFGDDTPSEGELRVAQAQLVGWLEGLFHGIQAALYAQQVQAQSQFQNMRLALPAPNDGKGDDSTTSDHDSSSGGMYL